MSVIKASLRSMLVEERRKVRRRSARNEA